MDDATSTTTLVCPQCGAIRPKPKNWTRIARWKREARQCRSCASTRHGEALTPLYRAWQAMMSRCGHHKVSNPSAKKYYVDRGITVCLEWRTYIPFAEWAKGNGYRQDLTLDRIDNGQGYGPTNCRWISMADNLRNRSCVKLRREDIPIIRARLAAGESQRVIAADYDVAPTAISRINTGHRWADV